MKWNINWNTLQIVINDDDNTDNATPGDVSTWVNISRWHVQQTSNQPISKYLNGFNRKSIDITKL